MPGEDVCIVRRLLPVLVLALGIPASASAGGIADETCPNVAGEHTNTCPPGTVGFPYHLRFRENEGSGCGPGRQTFHHDSGELPPGLTLEPDGTLSGTPRTPGRFRFYVQMREPQDDPATCAGKRTEKQFTVWIRRPVSVAASASWSPHAEVGARLRARLRARGGTGVFAWSAVRLAPGVRLRGDGSITGVPRTPGTYVLEVRARDTEARSTSWIAAVRIAPRLDIRTRVLVPATVGRRYRATVRTIGGVAPNVWTLARGALPRGVRLERRTGQLVGRPSRTGRHRVRVRVRDRLGVRSEAALTLVVHAPESAPRTRAARRPP